MNLIEHCKKIVVLQVGCGGTGSWLVPLVSKLLGNIKLRLPETIELTYILNDNDVVEDRNILRQNFNKWDIGKGKAMSLISSYCYNFKNMSAITNRIKNLKNLFDIVFNTELPYDPYEIRQETLVVVIGCVDNNKSRQFLDKILKRFNKKYECPIVYIDSGNLLYNGQIVTLSYGFNEFLIQLISEFEEERAKQLKQQLKLKKKINLKEMFPLTDEEEVTQSCAFFGDQSQSINSLAATMLFCNLQKILISSEIPPKIITFNSSGYSTFEV